MPREANLARKISKKPEKDILERVSKRKSMPQILKLARIGHTGESLQKKSMPREAKKACEKEKGHTRG